MAASVVGFGLLVIALGLIFGGASAVSDDRPLGEVGVPVDGSIGRIFGMQRHGGYAGYRYSYSWDGRAYENSGLDGADGFYLGAPITVLVDPDDPTRSVVQGRTEGAGEFGHTLAQSALVLGALTVAVGAYQAWRCWRVAPPSHSPGGQNQ